MAAPKPFLKLSTVADPRDVDRRPAVSHASCHAMPVPDSRGRGASERAPEHGRDAQSQPWSRVYDELAATDRATPLEPADLERLAQTACLTGRHAESIHAWSRAHNEYLEREDPARAAFCAFWLGFTLLYRGSRAEGSGWLSRARRLLDETRLDCVTQGYLLVPAALGRMIDDDYSAAYSLFSEAAAIGDRFRERDLMTFGRLGQGEALIAQNRSAEGVALLDEAMVSVTVGEVSPLAAGIVYCAVIEVCQKIYDLRRAQEWTAALTRWCDAHADMVPYRGQCLVHRAELLTLHGAWKDAMDEAERARKRLSDPPDQPAIGQAFYQQGELHRLRGEFVQAEEAYRQAGRWIRRPRPGLAQLRLSQGQLDSAQAMIRHQLGETQDQHTRPPLLAACAEITLATGDTSAARVASDELSAIAATVDTPYLHALSERTAGAVLLAEGDAHAADASLRDAWVSWQQLEAPYESARTRVLIALACRALGDEDAAQMELDAARMVFRELGAAPDLARVEQFSREAALRGAGPLTRREVQVLRLVATGKTNRAIAAELFISEKTVARHVSNVFGKLGVESRAAATAWAFKHEIV